MTATYDCIATTTLGSAQASVTFSSISGSYTDLVLVIGGALSSSDGPTLQFNNDTGSNYSDTFLYGNGSSATSGRNSSQSEMAIGYMDTGQSNMIVHIMNYANTTTYKTALGRGNAPAALTIARVGLWRSTAAISTIKVKLSGVLTFNSGSTFTLYGIKAE